MAKTISRTTSAAVIALLACTMSGCKRTTAGTAGEGGNRTGIASASTSRSGSSASGTGTSDSAGRIDSAGGSLTLSPNGSVLPITPSGTNGMSGILAPSTGATSVFLPTLGTTVQVPSMTNPLPFSANAPSASHSLLSSPLLPARPTINPAQPDSNLVPRPAGSGVTPPPSTARPNSTLVRPVMAGTTAAVIKSPE